MWYNHHEEYKTCHAIMRNTRHVMPSWKIQTCVTCHTFVRNTDMSCHHEEYKTCHTIIRNTKTCHFGYHIYNTNCGKIKYIYCWKKLDFFLVFADFNVIYMKLLFSIFFFKSIFQMTGLNSALLFGNGKIAV